MDFKIISEILSREVNNIPLVPMGVLTPGADTLDPRFKNSSLLKLINIIELLWTI